MVEEKTKNIVTDISLIDYRYVIQNKVRAAGHARMPSKMQNANERSSCKDCIFKSSLRKLAKHNCPLVFIKMM